MRRLQQILEAESFRVLVFVMSFLLLLWPYLPNKTTLSYDKLLNYFFLLWGAIIVLLFAMAKSLSFHDKNDRRKEK